VALQKDYDLFSWLLDAASRAITTCGCDISATCA